MSESWRARLESLPHDPPDDPGGRVAVLSAHPDDEVLGLGAWLSTLRGRDVVFVTATDGEASHPGSPTVTPEDLRRRRPIELVEALHRLGLDEPDVRRLGLPDGGLAEAGPALEDALGELVRDARLVVAPFEADGHPDHDAVGRAAARTLPDGATLWQYPVWTWAWTTPEAQPWAHRLRRLPGSSAARDHKARGIDAFVTQVEPLSDHEADAPVVGGALLRHALTAPEVVIA